MKIGRERDAFVVVITFGSATLHHLQPVLGVKRTNCECECVQRARLSQSLHLLFIASVVRVVVIVFYATDRARLKTPVGLQLLFFTFFWAFLGIHSCGIPFPTHQKKDSNSPHTTNKIHTTTKFITEEHTRKPPTSSRLRRRRCRTYMHYDNQY
jgi:hypothetical protein